MRMMTVGSTTGVAPFHSFWCFIRTGSLGWMVCKGNAPLLPSLTESCFLGFQSTVSMAQNISHLSRTDMFLILSPERCVQPFWMKWNTLQQGSITSSLIDNRKLVKMKDAELNVWTFNLGSNFFLALPMNKPIYNYWLLRFLAFEWKWGWSWSCFDRSLTAFLM